jgi:hypothetical protein
MNKRLFPRRLWICSVLALAACRLRSDGPAPAELAPTFALPDEDGEVVSLAALTHGAGGPGATVLVFYRGHW